MTTFASIVLEVGSLRNPFAVAQLREDIKVAHSAAERLGCHQFHGKATELLGLNQELLSRQLSRAALVLECELSEELEKPNHIRFSGFTTGGQDDAWRTWVVLDRELSEQVLARDTESWRGDDVTGADLAVADVWATLGFDASHSPLSEYSPTGRMYRNQVTHRVINGHVVISQTGGRDV